MTSEVRIDNGIEIITTKVERQEPRNRMIIIAVSTPAMAPSFKSATIDALTKTDWSNSSLIIMPGGAQGRQVARASFTALTTASVEALPFLMMESSTERWPSVRTTF